MSSAPVLIEEYFLQRSPLFLDALLRCEDDPWLAAFAKRWAEDLRPWAREQLFGYVDDGCDRRNHRPLVKRLFKHAERSEDDELMAAFLVAFDRMVKHHLVEQRSWNWRDRRYETRKVPMSAHYPSLQWLDKKTKIPRFTRETRDHLRRRALRYFRRMAYREPERFRRGVSMAFRRYRQEHLARPEQLIDARNLIQLLFHGDRTFRWNARRVYVRWTAKIGDARVAPMAPHAWVECFDEVLALVRDVDARVIRRAMIEWAEQTYPEHLAAMTVSELQPLLTSEHPEVQSFAVARLEGASGVESLAIADWLRLLSTQNAETLDIVLRLLRAHVTPDRLDLEDLLGLAKRAEQPVADLGLEFLRMQHSDPDDETLLALMSLRDAKAEKVRASAASWLCELLRERGTVDMVRELVDARHPDVRDAAYALLEGDRFRDATPLWQALAESPYPDARALLVTHLESRSAQLDAEDLRRVWASTLLAIHRGSRDKRKVLRLLATRVIARPAEADAILPLLAYALRSVRAAERRAALAQIVRAAHAAPALREALSRHVPELELAA